jgi:hypothetical protein
MVLARREFHLGGACLEAARVNVEGRCRVCVEDWEAKQLQLSR